MGARSIAIAFVKQHFEARYSEHYEITVEELNWLAEEVERLKALVEQVCEAALETELADKGI